MGKFLSKNEIKAVSYIFQKYFLYSRLSETLIIILLQIPQCKKMAFTQKTPNRTSTQTGLERLLGLPKRHYSAVLSMRFTFPRGSTSGNGAKTSNHRRWRHNATNSRASETGLHFLSEHGIRWRLFIPSPLPGESLSYNHYNIICFCNGWSQGPLKLFDCLLQKNNCQ